ncbi:MAG: DNA mismatch repair protein MutT, partial [Thermocrispum sp.]
VKQSGGKVVTAWALSGEVDLEAFTPGTFELEWPPRSGRLQTFPELDRVAWFDLTTARGKMVKAQAVLLDRLADLLG